MQSKIARNRIFIIIGFADCSRFEDQLRVALRIEEITRAQVIVTIRIASINTAQINVKLDAGCCQISRVRINDSVKSVKGAFYFGSHHVSNGEIHTAVCCIHDPF